MRGLFSPSSMLVVIKLNHLICSLQQMQRKEISKISRKKSSVLFFFFSFQILLKLVSNLLSFSVLTLTGDVEWKTTGKRQGGNAVVIS